MCQQVLVANIPSRVDAMKQISNKIPKTGASVGGPRSGATGTTQLARALMPRMLRNAPDLDKAAETTQGEGRDAKGRPPSPGCAEKSQARQNVSNSDEQEEASLDAGTAPSTHLGELGQKASNDQQNAEPSREAGSHDGEDLVTGDMAQGFSNETSQPQGQAERLPDSTEGVEDDGSSVPEGTDRARGESATNPKVTLVEGCKVSFRKENFVAEPHNGHGYDVISLFSVVKWMHLNGGDDAIRRVFRKAHALLKPGGRLILEPQVS